MPGSMGGCLHSPDTFLSPEQIPHLFTLLLVARARVPERVPAGVCAGGARTGYAERGGRGAGKCEARAPRLTGVSVPSALDLNNPGGIKNRLQIGAGRCEARISRLQRQLAVASEQLAQQAKGPVSDSESPRCGVCARETDRALPGCAQCGSGRCRAPGGPGLSCEAGDSEGGCPD